MESQGNNKCIKRMFSDAVICLKEEKRVKTLMNDIKCSQSRKELKSIDDVIDSCMKNAYDFGDYD